MLMNVLTLQAWFEMFVESPPAKEPPRI